MEQKARPEQDTGKCQGVVVGAPFPPTCQRKAGRDKGTSQHRVSPWKPL